MVPDDPTTQTVYNVNLELWHPTALTTEQRIMMMMMMTGLLRPESPHDQNVRTLSPFSPHPIHVRTYLPTHPLFSMRCGEN